MIEIKFLRFKITTVTILCTHLKYDSSIIYLLFINPREIISFFSTTELHDKKNY